MSINNLRKFVVLFIIFTVLASLTCNVYAGEPFLGEVKLFAFNFPPKGWAYCNGQLLPINQNQALFALLGTQYGGDGRVNFALPNLNEQSSPTSTAQPWGKYNGGYYCIALQGVFPSQY